ncbi:MAG: histidine kinase [Myxococcota bacterium]
MIGPTASLDEPLPEAFLRRSSRSFASYQNFPAFSWPWLRGRTLVAVVALGAFGFLNALGRYASTQDVTSAVVIFAGVFFGGLTLVSAGPALATLVRTRAMAPQKELWGIRIALVAGVAISFGADMLASAIVEDALERPEPAHPPEGMNAALMLVANVAILLFIYGMLGGFLAYRRYREELVEGKRWQEIQDLRDANRDLDLRLSILQAQLEPHFLFNALASVRSLITVDPASAASALDALTSYFRATIPRLRESDVESTLGQQLEMVESYLEVMSVRIERLNYAIEADDSLGLIEFPPLLLLTLVENAIVHGVRPAMAARVDVRVAMEGDELIVSVADEGPGLREGGGGGVGLANLHRQLALRYRGQAKFSLQNRPEGGAIAELRIPVDSR